MTNRQSDIIKARGVLLVDFFKRHPASDVQRVLKAEKLIITRATTKGHHHVLDTFDKLAQDLEKALDALDKIRDPRKRHSEPDKYTELGCVMNIADLAYREVMGETIEKDA